MMAIDGKLPVIPKLRGYLPYNASNGEWPRITTAVIAWDRHGQSNARTFPNIG
jgi:hypothetical protein